LAFKDCGNVLARLDPFGVALSFGAEFFCLTGERHVYLMPLVLYLPNTLLKLNIVAKDSLTIFKQIALNESKEVTAALSRL
jgi:hypothetical protein